MPAAFEIRRFAAGMESDFFDLHGSPPGECFCMYWYLQDGRDWSRVSAAENRAGREALLARGAGHDGYLAYVDGKVAAWVQVGPRDRLPNLRKRMVVGADPTVWSISCFFVLPEHRRKTVATRLLRRALADLKAAGVKRVEAYPRRGEALTADDMWNGPESMLSAEGFRVVRDDAVRPVMAKDL
jgi:GNAT superfamily N-acetyltransferase